MDLNNYIPTIEEDEEDDPPFTKYLYEYNEQSLQEEIVSNGIKLQSWREQQSTTNILDEYKGHPIYFNCSKPNKPTHRQPLPDR